MKTREQPFTCKDKPAFHMHQSISFVILYNTVYIFLYQIIYRYRDISLRNSMMTNNFKIIRIYINTVYLYTGCPATD